MDVQIQSSNIDLSEGFCEQVGQSFASALDDFSDCISELVVHLEAVSTPEETFGLACRIHLDLGPSGTLTAQAIDGNVEVAISRATHRIGHCLGVDMYRMRRFQRSLPFVHDN